MAAPAQLLSAPLSQLEMAACAQLLSPAWNQLARPPLDSAADEWRRAVQVVDRVRVIESAVARGLDVSLAGDLVDP